MPFIYLDQGGEQGDGYTVSHTDVPGFIGWGENKDEAQDNLTEQLEAVMNAIGNAQERLDEMGY